MAEEIKPKVVETEEKSIQEKEEVVQKNSGFDEESGMYKVDLTKPPVQEQEKTLVESLNKKYGPGQLDPATGVFTPTSTPTDEKSL